MVTGRGAVIPFRSDSIDDLPPGKSALLTGPADFPSKLTAVPDAAAVELVEWAFEQNADLYFVSAAACRESGTGLLRVSWDYARPSGSVCRFTLSEVVRVKNCRELFGELVRRVVLA